MSNTDKTDIAAAIAKADTLGTRGKMRLVAILAWPAIMAQLSTIVMQYIDAAMVGRLGPTPSAAIGLVATTTWLFWGIGYAAVSGFSVQVAHRIGASDDDGARLVVRQGFAVVTAISIALAIVAALIAKGLPQWLGGDDAVCADATAYFFVFAVSMPFMFVSYMVSSALRCSGNMLVPGIVNVVMCVLDVIFNYFLIFKFGLGVTGAAIGTGLAELVAGAYMLWYMVHRDPHIAHPWRGIPLRRLFARQSSILRRARSISWPIALERVVMCAAQIAITAIVAPLGTAAIAANAFAVTAESLCYMPGYGISDAATTIVGQCLGAGRKSLAVSFAKISVYTGMAVMGVLGVAMWWAAPEMMALLSPDAEVCRLGTMALRTEAWAEPMFGAAIVTYGVCMGSGWTFKPACINLGCIWAVRLTLSAILAPRLGLFGIWLAMCIELCVRGSAYLITLWRRRWLTHGTALTATPTDPEVDPTPYIE